MLKCFCLYSGWGWIGFGWKISVSTDEQSGANNTLESTSEQKRAKIEMAADDLVLRFLQNLNWLLKFGHIVLREALRKKNGIMWEKFPVDASL